MALLRPNMSHGFYFELFTRARDEWGMSMLFKDDLMDQGRRLAAAFPHTFGAHFQWFNGLALALDELGLSMQACMTAPFEIMMSATMPAVSNARVSDDGGRDAGKASLGAVLTALLGVAWSKDNVRTARDGNPHTPPGFHDQQMLLATLSLGPVGIADALTALPDDPAARISSNVSLIQRGVSLNGTLLQPSYPLTPLLEPFCAAGRGPYCATGDGATVWATHTTLSLGGSGGGGGTVCHYFIAVGFRINAIAQSSGKRRAGAVPGAAGVAPPPRTTPVCGWIAHADKSHADPGRCFRIMHNTTRAVCCAACWADSWCDAFVRDPAHGTCYLIDGMNGTNATVPSQDREIGFMPAGRPVPPGPAPAPGPPSPGPPPPPFSLVPSLHLAPLVDESAELRAFAQVPSGFYLGAGTPDPAEFGQRYVYFDAGSGELTKDCATAVPVTGGVPIHVGDVPQLLVFAPRLPNASVVLLGELGKFAAVSTYRFAAVTVLGDGSGAISVTLNGNVGETVALRFAALSTEGDGGMVGDCGVRRFLLPRNGETTVTLRAPPV